MYLLSIYSKHRPTYSSVPFFSHLIILLCLLFRFLCSPQSIPPFPTHAHSQQLSLSHLLCNLKFSASSSVWETHALSAINLPILTPAPAPSPLELVYYSPAVEASLLLPVWAPLRRQPFQGRGLPKQNKTKTTSKVALLFWESRNGVCKEPQC